MLTQADTDRALNVPCPLTRCSAHIGEWCVSLTSGRAVPPHRHRLISAGVIAEPAPPVPAIEHEEKSA